jgi:hypothetical protein
MAIFHGIVINFGIGTTLVNFTGVFQTRTHVLKAESKEILDGGETAVGKAYFNYKEEASFTYIPVSPVGFVNAGNLSFGIPYIGQYITVNEFNNYNQIAGTWLVSDLDIQSSNTSATRVNIKLERYPYSTFPTI